MATVKWSTREIRQQCRRAALAEQALWFLMLQLRDRPVVAEQIDTRAACAVLGVVDLAELTGEAR